jgi:hypothetical protein
VKRCPVEVVGPDLHHVAGVDDEGTRDRFDVDPAVAVADLEAPDLVLQQYRQSARVGVMVQSHVAEFGDCGAFVGPQGVAEGVVVEAHEPGVVGSEVAVQAVGGFPETFGEQVKERDGEFLARAQVLGQCGLEARQLGPLVGPIHTVVVGPVIGAEFGVGDLGEVQDFLEVAPVLGELAIVVAAGVIPGPRYGAFARGRKSEESAGLRPDPLDQLSGQAMADDLEETELRGGIGDPADWVRRGQIDDW